MSATAELIAKHHDRYHLGVDRTLYLAKLEDPTVTRTNVAKLVDKCSRCRSIDPVPVKWKHGELSVKQDWFRLSADVTHYAGKVYFTLVDYFKYQVDLLFGGRSVAWM